jgi:hypothetical protein
MKTIALLAILSFGILTVAGCHRHHRGNNYSNGYYNR